MDEKVAALQAAHGDKTLVLMSNTGGSDGPQVRPTFMEKKFL